MIKCIRSKLPGKIEHLNEDNSSSVYSGEQAIRTGLYMFTFLVFLHNGLMLYFERFKDYVLILGLSK